MKKPLNKSAEFNARIYLVLSMVIFGTIGIFRRHIPLPSGSLTCVRGLIGATALLIIMFIIIIMITVITTVIHRIITTFLQRLQL